MVYTAHSKSLAILEILVNLQRTGPPPSYSLVDARFDESLVESLDRSALPRNWRANPAASQLRSIGDA